MAHWRFGNGSVKAQLYLQKLETATIYLCQVHQRYGTIVNDVKEAGQTLRYLNEQHPTIKFEFELPDESGFLPILDVKIMINEDGSTQEPRDLHHNLRFECRIYQKSLMEEFDTY